MEDQELLLQKRILTLLHENRERGAELLLETYTPLLWTVCQRRLSDPEDVKECINDVFITFCMNLDKYDPQQASLKNYLAMIADRRAISYYRSNQRRSEAESAVSYPEIQDPSDLHSELEDALSRLQPSDAQIIRMKYYGGMTYREIAKEMGITEETAKKRGSRSLRKMAKWLILGLLIAALLAGCAYVAHYYFRYSRGLGIIQNPETTVYQMVGTPELRSANGLNFHLLNVSCSGGETVVTMTTIPADGGITQSTQGLHYNMLTTYETLVNGISSNGGSSSDIIAQSIFILPAESLEFDEEGRLHLYIELNPRDYLAAEVKSKYGYEMDLSTLRWDVILEETDVLQDLSDLGYYLETTYADFLVLTDWSFTAESGEEYTLISLCPIYQENELTLSALLSTCFSPLGDREMEYVTLTDSAGNSYTAYRTVKPISGRLTSEFTLWFKDLPPGEYTLSFPSLCYQVVFEPCSLTLPLPKEDGITLACDETLTLPNGASVRISGVTRVSDSESGVYMTEYWENGVQSWVPEEDTMTKWHYSFDYEVTDDDSFPLWGLSVSDEFGYDTATGLTLIPYTSGMHHVGDGLDTLSFGVRDSFGMDAPDAVTLTFHGFYCADPQNYSIPITVK